MDLIVEVRAFPGLKRQTWGTTFRAGSIGHIGFRVQSLAIPM
jgi:hypothetical protein